MNYALCEETLLFVLVQTGCLKIPFTPLCNNWGHSFPIHFSHAMYDSTHTCITCLSSKLNCPNLFKLFEESHFTTLIILLALLHIFSFSIVSFLGEDNPQTAFNIQPMGRQYNWHTTEAILNTSDLVKYWSAQWCMGKIYYEQLIIAPKLPFWLRKFWVPADLCQGNAPGN